MLAANEPRCVQVFAAFESTTLNARIAYYSLTVFVTELYPAHVKDLLSNDLILGVMPVSSRTFSQVPIQPSVLSHFSCVESIILLPLVWDAFAG